jgi:transposase
MEMITISKSEIERIKAEERKNKNKRVDKKLQVLILRYEGKSNREISEKTGYNERYITTLMGQYQKQGLEEFIRIKQTSHRRNLSEADEASVLEDYEQKANEGHELTAAEIRLGLEKALGRKTSGEYVYRVLRRHGWRKVMPRSKHPKAATEEEQDSSKKLKLTTTKWSPKTPSKMCE